MPAHRSGATPARLRLVGTLEDEVLVDDDAVGIAAIRDRGGLVLVRGIERERQVRAEVSRGPPVQFGQVRSESTRHPTAARSPGLNLLTAGPTLSHSPDDFVAGDDWVDGGHDAAPFVADRMEVGVADAAEEDFDLHVALRQIAPHDRGRP